MKKVLALILALVMVFALAACGGSGDETSAPPVSEDITTPDGDNEGDVEPSATNPVELGEPIKIGHIVDLTGVEASTGKEAERSFNFAIQWIGGVIANRPIEVITGDSQSNPSTAVDVARKMVETDGVVAIFGPTQIGHKSNVAEYIATVGIPLIFYNGTPERLLSGNDWVVGAGGATVQMPTVMAEYLYDEGIQSVNTLTQENSGGHSYLDPFIAKFTALGGTVASSVWTPVPCADYGPYLTTMPEADALIAWVSGSDAISLWGSWYDMGIYQRMPMAGAMHGGFTDFFVPTALSTSNPSVIENMIGSVVPIMYAVDSETAENQEFVAAWTEEYGAVPPGSNLPGACAQAVLLFQAAVEATNGDTTPDVLIEAILGADIYGPEGHTFFAEGSHAATKDVHIVALTQLEDGTFNYHLVKTYADVPPSGN